MTARKALSPWIGMFAMLLAGSPVWPNVILTGPENGVAAVVVRSAVPADSRSADGPGGARTLRRFQLAFVTRLESTSFNEEFTVYSKKGKAESLQAPVPGVMFGSYLEQVLLTDPETDFTQGLFKVRETLTTELETLTWESVVILHGTGLQSY